MKNMKNIKNIKKLITSAFFLLIFMFTAATEVYANGNTTADAPDPAQAPVEPAAKKSVRRAPIRRPAQKAVPKTTQNKAAPVVQIIEPPQPSSLEMGIRMMNLNRYEHARLWLQKAVQEERNNPYAWYWYGVAHDKVGQYQQAQFFYSQAVALDPAFPPFLRVVNYPEEGDNRALWDPIRPAQVYPVELGSQKGLTTVQPGSPNATYRPTKPDVDPSLPNVPVYVPPEVVSVPGDAVQPPVYVPPDFSNTNPVFYETTPVYTPPTPENVNANQVDRPVYVPPLPSSSNNNSN